MDLPHDLQSMLDAYRRDPRSLSAPHIPDDVLAFLDAGLTVAERVDGRMSDPLLALGSDVTYCCRNATGQTREILLWGNTDGWGMLWAND